MSDLTPTEQLLCHIAVTNQGIDKQLTAMTAELEFIADILLASLDPGNDRMFRAIREKRSEINTIDRLEKEMQE
ncbi:MAG: hypothetical protein ACTMIK_12990 [Galactobacter sp.]|uniref:hypothetical protein n=1 Tax=Corynebacterium variabile TaxID=1727 RepID=UPI003FD2EA59